MGIFDELKEIFTESFDEAMTDIKKISKGTAKITSEIAKTTSEIVTKENIRKVAEGLAEEKEKLFTEENKQLLMSYAKKKMTKENIQETIKTGVKAGIEMKENIEIEKIKMAEYNFETLLEEKRKGSFTHRSAALSLLKEKFNYEGE